MLQLCEVRKAFFISLPQNTKQKRRGTQQELLYLDSSRVMLKYLLPLSEVVVDFIDQVKSLSSGYARYIQ